LDLIHWDTNPDNPVNASLKTLREYSVFKAQIDDYCSNRYGENRESNLYADAVGDFKDNRDATKSLPGNEGIDISKRLGVVVNDDGSMSSSLEDFLEYAKPNKSGTHGVCLDDIEIEIGNEIIVLEISRVCEWLEYLGTILLFISYFIAFQIIARD